MFSSSVAGAGTICLGCQLRAVTRRIPVLAASSGAAAAAQCQIRRQQRRHASSGSSEAGSSNDDFFERVLREQRHGEEFDKPKPRKKGRKYLAKNKKKDEEPFVRTFNDRSIREGSYTQPEVTFEDVWDQDPDLELEPEATGRGAGRNRGRSGLAPVEETPDEVDYGSTTHDVESSLQDFSWNQQSPAEIREQFAGQGPRPKKVEPPPPEQPVVGKDNFDRPGDFKPSVHMVQGSESKLARTERAPKRPRAKPTDKKPTDNLFEPGKKSFAAAGNENVTSSGKEMVRPISDKESVAKTDGPKYYRKGDTKLVEAISQLSVETLGKDAPVIVLKEDGEWSRKTLRQDTRPTDPILRIEDNADQEEGLSLDVILENIDGLRPAHRILPAREFKAVFDILMKGFTAYQLETYVERDRKLLEEGNERPFLGVIPDEPTSRPWIVSQGRWTPEVTGAVEDVDHPLKGYILRTMPPKQRLVMQLMRECWDTSVQELLGGHGVLDIQVRDKEFKLLTCECCPPDICLFILCLSC